MYEGNPAELKMEKILVADGILDDSARDCRVRKYDLDEDYMYLELREGCLTDISLDAKYRCTIETRSESLSCTGVVKERFRTENINYLKFRIENGFYSVPDGRVDERKSWK